MSKQGVFHFSPSANLVYSPLTASSKTSKDSILEMFVSPVTTSWPKKLIVTWKCDFQPSLFWSLWPGNCGSDAPRATECPRLRLIGSLFSSVVRGLIMRCSQTNEAMHHFHATVWNDVFGIEMVCDFLFSQKSLEVNTPSRSRKSRSRTCLSCCEGACFGFCSLALLRKLSQPLTLIKDVCLARSALIRAYYRYRFSTYHLNLMMASYRHLKTCFP